MNRGDLGWQAGPALLAAVLLVLWVAVPAGHSFSRGIRDSAPPVALVFRALAESGEPVLDLTPSDVTLSVDGRTRPLRSLALVEFDASAREPAPGSAPASLPPPFWTNTSRPGRHIILLIDTYSVPQAATRLVKDAVTQLLLRLSARDSVSLVTMGRERAVVGPTTEHDRIATAVAALEMAGSDGCRVSTIGGVLMGLLGAWSGDAVSTIVAFASVSSATHAPNGQYCPLDPRQVPYLRDLAATSTADIWVVQVPHRDGSMVSATGVETLARAVAGEAIKLGSDAGTTVTRILRETSAFYRITFDVDSSERGTAGHHVDLTTSRKGTRLIVNREIAIPARADGESVRAALHAGGLARDLPLRAATFVGADPRAERVRVVAAVDSPEPAARLSNASVALFDEHGMLVAQWNATPDELQRALAMTAFVVRPGIYRLRACALDTQGRLGSVDGELHAALIEAPPMKLSELVLSVPGAGGDFSPVLEFGNEHDAVAWLEIYGAPSTASLSATFDLSHEGDTAPVVATRATILPAGSSGTRLVRAQLPIRDLASGDYIARMSVDRDGKRVIGVTRTLRKASR